MTKIKIYWLMSIFLALTTKVGAENKDPNAYSLMTAQDLKTNALSNVTITNHAGQSIDAAGLFIASFDINDCSSCFGGILGGDNLGGPILSPVTFKSNQSVPLGQNYLYNMLYSSIYYIKNNAGSSPCSLPGCSWPGDNPDVSGWCIGINAISRHSSYTYSNYKNGSYPAANAPFDSSAGNSDAFDYKYDLIDPSTLGVGNSCIGPITCNDQTMTCQVSSPQDETFQSY